MKKRLFLVLSLLGIYVSGQETIFSEDFNNGTTPTGWATLDRDRDGSSWKIMQGDFRTKSAGWNGNTGYMFVSEGYKWTPESEAGPLDVDDVLISPSIQLPAESNANIELTYKIGVTLDFLLNKKMNDLSYQLFVLEETESFYPTLVPIHEKRFSDSKTAETITLNLNQYRGKKIKLYWRHYQSFDQFMLLLDNVKIAKTIIKERKIYPNPTSDILQLQGFSSIKSYKIYNTAGRLVKTGNENISEISVKHFAQGVYILVIEDTEGKHSYKFIKIP